MRRPGRQRSGRRRTARPAAAVVLAASVLLLAGCAQSVDPIERLGRKAAQGVRPSGRVRDEAYRRWGLAVPLAAPPSRPVRPPSPPTGDVTRPRVVDRVATTDPVVFLTYDDAAGRDPAFAGMVRELRLPVSLFLTGSETGGGAGTLAGTAAGARGAAGAAVENRAPDRHALRGLSYAGQRAEICARQDRLGTRFGHRPRLLHPPQGRYDRTTLRAAADCGISAVVLWRATETSRGLAYTRGDEHLHPGDIVLVRSDGPTPHPLKDRTTRLLRHIQERGLTVGHLEDYL
ncbi:polysaccharide deacetylase family protein [Streptomyces sp. NPDC005573]|uniref:polysaccharide deacetylase family protein n=1 Tax=unclassified Streptomyces TaxID=2593676 RepID=UPI0033AEFA19